MSNQLPARPPTRRPPLGEATRRVNNTQQPQTLSKDPPKTHHEGLKVDGLLQVYKPTSGSPLPRGDYYPLREFQGAASPGSNAANPLLSAISKEYPATDSNRNSQISTVSTNVSDGKRIKTYIGPWKLGKTLGKGATARVRLAKHAYTGQQAAIKIVQKKNAQMSQAGSLFDLDQADLNAPDSEEDTRRMPVGIEREVAIMKLIQHPNIMKLYDIWENRTEIYLVLEYVDNGELFEHITAKGRLQEEEAMRYFRQILSAVGYCHSFNICHRDLKPENILLTKAGEIKIADFGMAALHQSPDHKLRTSCGSPHYAAPELIRGANYRGNKVDIWSMGVILYATLAGRLPFDVEGSGKDWLPPLLAKIRKGAYEMAPEFSEDAANLIWRILQVNPRDRINLSQIWRHPLVRKYDYLDSLGGGSYPQSPNINDRGRLVLRRSDISKELLRNLRSMWHLLTEQQLMDLLLSEEPNDQKLFYSLLVKYRDTQLENYAPDLGYSSSDYHHVRPLALTKTYSTCNFSQAKSKGHGRQVSRFTVISNVAETEQSYDPFKASRPQHLNAVRSTERAKVTIHRNREQANSIGKLSPTIRLPSRVSVAGSERSRYPKLAPPKVYASRSSLASSTRSRNSVVRPAIGNRRGVSFSHIRKQSISSQNKASPNAQLSGSKKQYSKDTEEGNGRAKVPRQVTGASSSTRYIRSRKDQAATSQPVLAAVSKPGRTSLLWTEDVRQLSSSLAKDCDEAFNRTSVISTNKTAENQVMPGGRPTSLGESSKKLASPSTAGTSRKPKKSILENRPLPPPPARSNSVKIELLEARKQAELRKSSGGEDSPGYIDRVVSHIDRLIQPSSPTQSCPDRRVTSLPAETRYISSGRPLPSIHETRGEDSSPRRASDSQNVGERHRHGEGKSSRIASAPEPRLMKAYQEDRFTNAKSQVKSTIRVVDPSSPGSPVKPPAPLTIRKKSSRGGPMPLMSGGLDVETDIRPSRRIKSGMELRQEYNAGLKQDVSPDLARIDESYSNEYDNHYANDRNSGTTIRKKASWFRRNSRGSEDEFRASTLGNQSLPSQSSSNDAVPPPIDHNPSIPKNSKGFSLRKLFKKRNSKPDMTITPYDIFDDATSVQDSVIEAPRPSHIGRHSTHEDPRARQIEPRQNWLAKLFHVKPAARYICFSVSKRRARQEITTILKEWKRYGIKEVQVDKQRNIVFGRVGAENFLEMKEVAFAGEVMTVIEHGKRSYLSIARFTQERGAASSFQKVVETLESVLKCRGMLLVDEKKKRMMIKTLNAL